MRVIMQYRGFLIGETSRDYIIVNKQHNAPYDAHGHLGKGAESIGTCKRVVDMIHTKTLAQDRYIRGCQARLVGHEEFALFTQHRKPKYYNRPRGGRTR